MRLSVLPHRRRLSIAITIVATIGLFACAEDEPLDTGAACASPDECFPEVEDRTELAGDVICLDRVEGGYCTHTCTVDEDCCAIPGECRYDYPQVCAPFESTGQMFCFLSCEDVDLDPDLSSDEHCHTYAHSAFGCRSTGGGSANRKVCLP